MQRQGTAVDSALQVRTEGGPYFSFTLPLPGSDRPWLHNLACFCLIFEFPYAKVSKTNECKGNIQSMPVAHLLASTTSTQTSSLLFVRKLWT